MDIGADLYLTKLSTLSKKLSKGNLFISIFFEINQKRINFKQFAILNAFLIKKIITKYASKKIDIKWPNDLLIKREKVCGILQEVIDYNNKKFLIIGHRWDIDLNEIIDYNNNRHYEKFIKKVHGYSSYL